MGFFKRLFSKRKSELESAEEKEEDPMFSVLQEQYERDIDEDVLSIESILADDDDQLGPRARELDRDHRLGNRRLDRLDALGVEVANRGRPRGRRGRRGRSLRVAIGRQAAIARVRVVAGYPPSVRVVVATGTMFHKAPIEHLLHKWILFRVTDISKIYESVIVSRSQTLLKPRITLLSQRPCENRIFIAYNDLLGG